MSRRTRLRLAACTTVLSAVPLLACGGGTEAVAPPPLTTSTPSASPSAVTPSPVPPSPVPSATPTPSIARPEPFPGELNEFDAGNFAGYYIQVLNYTRRTNDSSALRAISDASCEDCREVADVTDEFAGYGMYYANPDINFERAFVEYYDAESGEADVRITTSGDLGVVNNADGSTQGAPFPFEHAEAMVYMRFTSVGWQLVALP